jgi:hypothetical protein
MGLIPVIGWFICSFSHPLPLCSANKWTRAGYPQRPGGGVVCAGVHVFQAAPGRFGQHQGEREARHRDPGGEQQRAAQAEPVVKQREQEDADERAEFPDAPRRSRARSRAW